MIPRSPSLTVQLAPFEYGCCRSAPVVGEVLSGALFAHPADQVASVAPVEWDADRNLVAVDGGTALWACDDEFDFLRDVSVWISWHRDGVPGVQASGVVSALVQDFVGPPEHGSPRLRRTVDAVERFPAPIVDSDGLRYEPGCVHVTLDDLVLLEPTIHEVLEFRRQAERSRRTLHITAPARCFGATVPARHARVAIDLDDPAVEVSGAGVVDRGVVTGIATQVSVAQIVRMIDDCGLMMPAPIAAGTPAEDVRDSLFVVLVLDEDS